MICYECKKKFYFKRSFRNLFKEEEEFLCNNCYNKYQIKLQYEEIILDEYHAIILSMFPNYYKIDYNLFYKEYSKIFAAIYSKKGYIVLFFDHIYFNDYLLETLDAISKLFQSNLYILCFTVHNM